VVERANATRLVRRAGVGDYRELVRRSAEDPGWFWPLAIEEMGLEFSAPWSQVYDESRGPEWTTWFTGARLSIAHNCVHRWAERTPSAIAAVGLREDGSRTALTFAELSRDVTRLAEALVRLGVRAGDRVAIFLPMSPEVAIASHACAHIGAIQVPVFSGFAAPAVKQRLEASEAKVVITQRSSTRRGKPVPMLSIVEATGIDIPVILAPFELDAHPGTLPALEVDSETPYLLTYTSGTTGVPKGIVHVQGGFLVSIAREVCYQADVSPGDVVHFATDMGWIMGPWTVVGAGALGATIVFAEGAPDWPTDRLWRTVEQERVTSLGLSPTLVRALAPHGDPTADLSSLRTFVTTGEPWNPDPYRWLFDTVGKGRVPIINCSGGTEVGACFLSPHVVQPLSPCSLGGPALGMAIDVFDDDGRSVRGEVGELVCTKPWPGMTRGLYRDPQRYLDTYWSRYPGVWWHGDFASVGDDGQWFLHGRSDDTIKVAGKRLGPAEVETVVVAHPRVLEAAAVGVPDELKGETLWVFVVPGPGVEPDDELRAELFACVVDALGPSFRPAQVRFTTALPKTRSAKVLRRLIRSVVTGSAPGDLSGLEDPGAVDAITAAIVGVTGAGAAAGAGASRGRSA
jgi:acetyl-CoA synthetase